jgi:hypothetical protein
MEYSESEYDDDASQNESDDVDHFYLMLQPDEIPIYDSFVEQLQLNNIDYDKPEKTMTDLFEFYSQNDLDEAVNLKERVIQNYIDLQEQAEENEARKYYDIRRPIPPPPPKTINRNVIGAKLTKDSIMKKKISRYQSEVLRCEICEKDIARSSVAKHRKSKQHLWNLERQENNVIMTKLDQLLKRFD